MNNQEERKLLKETLKHFNKAFSGFAKLNGLEDVNFDNMRLLLKERK